jgi:hypothetical protein
MNPNCFKANYQKGEVWFILDDSFRNQCPPGTTTYTLAEAQTLAKKPEWTKRIVHEAKERGAHLNPTTQLAQA